MKLMIKTTIKNWIERIVVARARQLDLEQRVIRFAAYPKTGSTWLKFMLNHVFIDFFEIDDQPSKSVDIDVLTKDQQALPKILWSHEDSIILNEKGARNPNLDSVFEDRPPSKTGHKCLFLIRDPRDVAVSYFHQVTKRSANPMQFKSIDDFVLDPQLGVARVAAYYRRYQRYSYVFQSFMLVRYEDLLEHTERSLHEVLSFIGLRYVPKSLIVEAVAASKPNVLRAMEIKGEVAGMNSFDVSDPNALKVRKAKSGTYREELSDSTIEEVNKILANFNDPFAYLSRNES